MHGSDPQADRWLAQLRDGRPPQKAEARRQLAVIFEQRAMYNDAIELLVANARAGYRDAGQFEMLARLYRAVGNEHLAASAALEAARLRHPGNVQPPAPPQSPRGTGPYVPPPPSGGGPYVPQPPAGSAPYTTPPPPGAYGSAARPRRPGRWTGPPRQNYASTSVLGVTLTRPMQLAGWAAAGAVVLGAAAVSVTSPVTSVLFVVAAAALALAVSGTSAARRTFRVPAGPLGDGSLLFVGILAFLIGGALLPRGSGAPAAGQAGSGPLYAGTPTPTVAGSAGPTASPVIASAPGSAAAAGASGASPQTVGGAAPTDTTGQRFVIVSDASGVTLRVSPSSTRGGVSMGDGGLVTAMAPDRVVSGRVWREVSAPDGDRGWIEVERLKPAPTDPLPAFPNGRPPSGRSCTGGTSIKGYVSSGGELLYQRTGSANYYRTYPVICFRTEDEARAAGFKPGPGSPGSASASPTESEQPAGQVGSSGPDPPTVSANAAAGPFQPTEGARVRIVNAGSEGVRLRPEPGAEEVLRVLPDGALLVSLGEERDDGGRVWRRVRDDEATEGWVAADFLAAVPVTPTVTAAATARPTVTIVAAAPPPTQPPPTPPPPTAPVAPTQPPPTQPPPTQPPPTQVPAAATQAPPPPTPRATVSAPAPKPQPAPPATAVSKPTAVVPALAPTAPASAGQGRPSGMDCPSGQPIKGNHASSGEWIYHLPRGQYYSRTRPEACFATEADASRAGYRPSQR